MKSKKSAGGRKPPEDMIAGTVYETNNCGKLVVVEYNGAKDVLVRFIETGYEGVARADHIRRGFVKDPYTPSVFGVGYLGVGKHLATVDGKTTKVYDTWSHMFQRCYSTKLHARQPTYIGCSVDSSWHNFQVFGDWFDENYPADNNDYQLDKDLKVIGNKTYSADNCLFVSRGVNSFLLDCGAARGEYLIGCNYDKSRGKFMAWCSNPFTGKRDNLGRFPDELSAHLAWRSKKAEHAYELAQQQSDQDVKDALLRWIEGLTAIEDYKNNLEEDSGFYYDVEEMDKRIKNAHENPIAVPKHTKTPEEILEWIMNYDNRGNK